MFQVNTAHYYAQLFVSQWGIKLMQTAAGSIATLWSCCVSAALTKPINTLRVIKGAETTLYGTSTAPSSPYIYRLSSLSSMQYIQDNNAPK